MRAAHQDRLRYGPVVRSDDDVEITLTLSRDFDATGSEQFDLDLSFRNGVLPENAPLIAPLLVGIHRDAATYFARYDAAVVRAAELGASKPHGRSYPDEWWDQVAVAFFAFEEFDLHDPVQTFADSAGIPVATVNRWVRQVRNRLAGQDDNEEQE